MWQSAPATDFIVDGTSWGNDYPTVTNNGTWFWHDASNARVTSSADQKLLMNVSVSGFQRYWAQSLATQVADGQYDGIMLDSASPALLQGECGGTGGRARSAARHHGRPRNDVPRRSAGRGQSVKKGQVLVTLDARGAALGANVAEAQSKVAQSQLEEAQLECQRVKHLLETKAISQAEFDRQTADCTAKQWSATAAQAQAQTATKLLGDTRVRAPFDGIVGERYVNVGQWVASTTRVLSVYEPDPLRLQLRNAKGRASPS